MACLHVYMSLRIHGHIGMCCIWNYVESAYEQSPISSTFMCMSVMHSHNPNPVTPKFICHPQCRACDVHLSLKIQAHTKFIVTRNSLSLKFHCHPKSTATRFRVTLIFNCHPNWLASETPDSRIDLCRCNWISRINPLTLKFNCHPDLVGVWIPGVYDNPIYQLHFTRWAVWGSLIVRRVSHWAPYNMHSKSEAGECDGYLGGQGGQTHRWKFHIKFHVKFRAMLVTNSQRTLTYDSKGLKLYMYC
jgi:hypothetical protein